MRVEINIVEPLVKSLATNCDYPKPRKVKVKYENLKNFCFYCRMLDHDDRDCAKKNEDREKGIDIDEVQKLMGFDPKLKVEMNSLKLPHEIFHERNEPTISKDDSKRVSRNLREEFESKKITSDSSTSSLIEGTIPVLCTKKSRSKQAGMTIEEWVSYGGILLVLPS